MRGRARLDGEAWGKGGNGVDLAERQAQHRRRQLAGLVALRAHGLHKRYGTRTILADVSRAVREFFSPELFNRIDRIVPFSPLSPETAMDVAQKELEKLSAAAESPKQTITYERTGRREWRPLPAESFARLPVQEIVEIVPEPVQRRVRQQECHPCRGGGSRPVDGGGGARTALGAKSEDYPLGTRLHDPASHSDCILDELRSLGASPLRIIQGQLGVQQRLSLDENPKYPLMRFAHHDVVAWRCEYARDRRRIDELEQGIAVDFVSSTDPLMAILPGLEKLFVVGAAPEHTVGLESLERSNEGQPLVPEVRVIRADRNVRDGCNVAHGVRDRLDRCRGLCLLACRSSCESQDELSARRR